MPAPEAALASPPLEQPDIEGRAREIRREALEEASRIEAADAFEMGFEWAMMLRGQTMEDSRAVGRTLYCNLFNPIAERIVAEMERVGFNSFEHADYGIVSAKAIIRAALACPPSRPSFDKWDYAAAVLADARCAK